MALFNAPEWGVTPVQGKHRTLGGLDYFILWSSLGVGLLVFSAGSLLSDASFIDAILAILVGSAAGSKRAGATATGLAGGDATAGSGWDGGTGEAE